MERLPVDNHTALYDEDLDFTQRMRRLMVDEMTEEGTSMPVKVGAQLALLQTLDSMDTQTFKRIERQEGSAIGGAIAAEVGKFMVELAKTTHHDPFRVEEPKHVEREVNLPPIKDVTEFELSQEINYGKSEFDDFKEAFLRDNPDYDT